MKRRAWILGLMVLVLIIMVVGCTSKRATPTATAPASSTSTSAATAPTATPTTTTPTSTTSAEATTAPAAPSAALAPAQTSAQVTAPVSAVGAAVQVGVAGPTPEGNFAQSAGALAALKSARADVQHLIRLLDEALSETDRESERRASIADSVAALTGAVDELAEGTLSGWTGTLRPVQDGMAELSKQLAAPRDGSSLPDLIDSAYGMASDLDVRLAALEEALADAK
jgi:hypothetical protein